MNNKISIIAKKITEGGKNIVFTGAGVSTESGIPDFRGKGGVWEKYRPVYIEEFMASKKARIQYWKRKSEFYYNLKRARPNSAHISITTLYDMGLLESVITQNIDGLHQKAGLPDEKVLELHGNTNRVRCMSCNKIISLDEAYNLIEAGDLAPECECGGYLKPATISFGEALPKRQLNNAIEISQSCDFFLVVGSTLLVQPAALMPDYAKEYGAFLAIINLSETPFDEKCDVVIRGKAGEVMTEIVNEVRTIL